jgi:hypothetical protein
MKKEGETTRPGIGNEAAERTARLLNSRKKVVK